MEHGEDLVHPGRVESPDRPPWLRLIRRRHQGLDLHQDRAPALNGRIDDRSGHLRLPALEKDLGRVVHLGQALAAHVEHPRHMGGPEAILDAAQAP